MGEIQSQDRGESTIEDNVKDDREYDRGSDGDLLRNKERDLQEEKGLWRWWEIIWKR